MQKLKSYYYDQRAHLECGRTCNQAPGWIKPIKFVFAASPLSTQYME